MNSKTQNRNVEAAWSPLEDCDVTTDSTGCRLKLSVKGYIYIYGEREREREREREIWIIKSLTNAFL